MTAAALGVAVSGAAYSEVGRKLGRTVLSLACESGLRAIQDAGLRAEEIDGYCAYGGAGGRGFSGPSSYEVMDSLGIHPEWHATGAEIPGQLGAVMIAALAIHAGMARHVLVQRTVAEATYGLSSQNMGSGGGGIGGDFSFLLPFNAVSAANWLAINARPCPRQGVRQGLLLEVLLEIRAASRD